MSDSIEVTITVTKRKNKTFDYSVDYDAEQESGGEEAKSLDHAIDRLKDLIDDFQAGKIK